MFKFLKKLDQLEADLQDTKHRLQVLVDYHGIEYFGKGEKQKPHYRKKRVPKKRKYTKRT